MQVDRPLVPPTVPQTLTQQEKIQETTKVSETPTLTKTVSKEQFDEQLLTKTDTESLTTPEQLLTIEGQIQKVSSKQMLLEIETAPVPEKLEVALDKVMDDNELLVGSTVPLKQVEKMYKQDVINELYTPKFKELSTDFTRALVTANKNHNLTDLFKDEFKDTLKRLDKSDSGFDAKRKIGVVINETKAQAKAFIEAMDANSDVSMLLKMQTRSERREMIKQMLGELKGYGSKELDKLSEKKEQFINAILDGIEEGLPNQQALLPKDTLSLSLEAIQNQVRQQVQDSEPLGDLVQTLSLSSSNKLMQVMTEQLGVKKPAFMEAIINGVIEGLPNQVEPVMIDVPGKPSLQAPQTMPINGVNYQLSGFLGDGGFANVLEYVNPDNPNDKIAVKQMKIGEMSQRELRKLRDQTVEEALSHLEIQGPDGHKNVIGFKGIVNGPLGQVYIAQEVASGGDVSKLRTKLEMAQKYNLLPPSARNLLSTQLGLEALRAMQYVQTERQGYHFDLKIHNMMIGSDKQVKLIDFGLSGTGRAKEWDSKTEVAENPIYKAPEQFTLDSKTVSRNINNYMKEHYGLFKPEQPSTVREPKKPTKPEKPTNKKDLEAMKKYEKAMETYEDLKVIYEKNLIRRENYVKAVAQYNIDYEHYEKHKDEHERLFNDLDKRGIGHVTMDQKVDTWNMGLTLYELCYGNPKTHEIWAPDFLTPIQENLVAFGQSDKRIIEKDELTPMDKVINSLMHPKPEHRPSLDSVLESSAFQDERLDSDKLKELQTVISRLPMPPEQPREGDVEGNRRYTEELLPAYEQQLLTFKNEVDPILKSLNLA